MQGESAFKIGSILLMIGFAVGGAQFSAQASAVTSLEAQALAPGVDPQTTQESSEISPEELAATLKPTKADTDTIMRSLGYGSLRDDAAAAASVEQINSGRFQPFQTNSN